VLITSSFQGEEDFISYRHSIAKFDILLTTDGAQRWKEWIFVINVLDIWIPDHFKKICSAIDMLPANLHFEVPGQS
jgi:hypothetical protein